MAELGLSPACPDSTLCICLPFMSICLGQGWEEGDRKDCFSLEGTVVFWAARGRGRRGQQVPRVAGTSGLTEREAGEEAAPEGLQGEEKASRGRSITPGKEAALLSSRQRWPVLGSRLQPRGRRGWRWLPWLHRSSLPHPPLAPALTWLQLSPQGAAGISPCLAACDGGRGLCVDMGEEMG